MYLASWIVETEISFNHFDLLDHYRQMGNTVLPSSWALKAGERPSNVVVKNIERKSCILLYATMYSYNRRSSGI